MIAAHCKGPPSKEASGLQDEVRPLKVSAAKQDKEKKVEGPRCFKLYRGLKRPACIGDSFALAHNRAQASNPRRRR
jgi:hypothetical protein